MRDHADVVEALLRDVRTDASLATTRGMTPLYAACLRGLPRVVSALLPHRHVDIRVTDEAGRTPLYAATTRGHHAVVQLLLRRAGVPLEGAAAERGVSPLYAAVLTGRAKRRAIGRPAGREGARSGAARLTRRRAPPDHSESSEECSFDESTSEEPLYACAVPRTVGASERR